MIHLMLNIYAFTSVTIPRIISATAPSRLIHFLNRGALFSSQPVAPPSNRIGDNEVPIPKSTAKAKLSNGAVKVSEYATSHEEACKAAVPETDPKCTHASQSEP